MAVQRFCKPKVGGSNPSPGTNDSFAVGIIASVTWLEQITDDAASHAISAACSQQGLVNPFLDLAGPLLKRSHCRDAR